MVKKALKKLITKKKIIKLRLLKSYRELQGGLFFLMQMRSVA